MHKYKHSKHSLPSTLLLLAFFLFTMPLAGQSTSPLKTGKWIKIAVTQSGFYQINPAWLAKNKLSTTSLEKICIYAAESGMVNPNDSYQNGLLKPIPAYYQSGTNASWNILFWGDSPHAIHQNGTWQQETHLYSDSTFYFIQLDAAKANPIKEIENSPTNTPTLPFAWSLKHYEPETYNLIQSGQTWLGDAFYGNSSKILQYLLPDYFKGQMAYLKIKLMSSSTSPSTFTIPALNKSIAMPTIAGGRYDLKATNGEITTWINPVLSNNTWSLPINFQSTGGTGYLDYISLMYPKTFDGHHENPLYLLPNTSDSLLQINIPNLGSSHQIWIKNGGGAWQKILNNSGFSHSFQPNSQLAIANFAKASEPNFCGLIENQNTFDLPTETELLILSSAVLQPMARDLANYKTTQRNVLAKNITTQAIYNDFSGGKQDATALRNFIRYQYQKPGSQLRYVILLGDASIDYKGQNAVSTALEKSCFVPTFQSAESFYPLLSYASDDYFGSLSQNEGPWKESDPIHVAVGRIPAKSPQEAKMFINKLADFESKQRPSTPRVAWVADDGDSNIHMQDAEDFSKTLLQALFPVRQEKVYLDQYPMQLTNGTYTSPEGTKAVLSLFKGKADFIHFMGHGSESGWTDEKLITTNELVALKNPNHLPIVLTATCQFGRFDDPNILSGGEVSLLSDQGGAIALISTTRPVFQSSNYLFGKAFYQAMITNKEQANYRLGDLFRDAKNASQTGYINRNIQLLGDPTLALPWSTKGLQITLDTIKQEINLAGLPVMGSTMQVSLYRISDSQKTLGTKNEPFLYTQMSPILWKSVGTSTSNSMKMSMRDMPSLASLQQYQLYIVSEGGSEKYAAVSEPHTWKNKKSLENKAPILQIAIPNEDLQATSTNPWVNISIADSSGLLWENAAGKIANLVLDDSVQIELGSKFIPETNISPKGSVLIQLKTLKPGKHKLQAYCWDIHNNYGEASLSFQVKQHELNSLDGLVYPNPLGPTFHFVFKQEKPWNAIPYSLEVYDLSGRLMTRKNGMSSYDEENKGKIEFDWTLDEYKQFNQTLLLHIQLKDHLTNEILSFRIKTSTLK